MDTTIYLDYLANRFLKADGQITKNVRLENLEDVDPQFDLVINCAGIGARELVHDADLEPHRGQVAIVPRIKDLSYAVVCDDAPFMYAIPRRNDCVFGGTNDLSDDLAVDSATTARIVAECSRDIKNRETECSNGARRAAPVPQIRGSHRARSLTRRPDRRSQLRPRWGRLHAFLGLRRRSSSARRTVLVMRLSQRGIGANVS